MGLLVRRLHVGGSVVHVRVSLHVGGLYESGLGQEVVMCWRLVLLDDVQRVERSDGPAVVARGESLHTTQVTQLTLKFRASCRVAVSQIKIHSS